MAENLDRIPRLLGDALVLVTGAGQGNGRAIALGVAAAGAKVIVTDVRQDTAQSVADEIQARGGRATAYGLDVTDATACTELAIRIAEEVGPANVLINNAGIIIRETIDSPRAPENWRRVMDVNVNGISMWCTRGCRLCVRRAETSSTLRRSLRSWAWEAISAIRRRRAR